MEWRRKSRRSIPSSRMGGAISIAFTVFLLLVRGVTPNAANGFHAAMTMAGKLISRRTGVSCIYVVLWTHALLRGRCVQETPERQADVVTSFEPVAPWTSDATSHGNARISLEDHTSCCGLRSATVVGRDEWRPAKKATSRSPFRVQAMGLFCVEPVVTSAVPKVPTQSREIGIDHAHEDSC